MENRMKQVILGYCIMVNKLEEQASMLALRSISSHPLMLGTAAGHSGRAGV